MNQVIHIFRKDTRHLWPEIVFSIAISAALVYVIPLSWGRLSGARVQILTWLTVLLVPVAWWLLTARGVQSESLVGDQQFWVTRPYGWKRLLAAKLLLLALWIGFTDFLVQLALLHSAGFQPWMYIPGVAAKTFLLLAALIVPALAIASVTSSFARFTLTVLALIVGFAVYLLVTGRAVGPATTLPVDDLVGWLVLLLGSSAAIGIQYASRRVWLARGVLLATVAVLALLPLFYRAQWLVDRVFPPPAAGSAQAFSVALIPSDAHPIEAREWKGKDYLDLPVEDVAPDGYAVVVYDFKYTLRSADGSSWTSRWMGLGGRVRSKPNWHILNLEMEPAVYERFKGTSVNIEVTYAVTRYRVASVTNWAYPVRNTYMPGVGYCAPQNWDNAALVCKSAVEDSPLVYAEVMWTSGPCRTHAGAEKVMQAGGEWLSPSTGLFPVTSVRNSYWVPRFGMDDGNRRGVNWNICDGNPMKLTQYAPLERTRTTARFEKVQLPAQVEKTG